MPDKDYEITLAPGNRIVVSIKMVGGRAVSFVVRLTVRTNGKESDVARYDTAHGWPHLDLLGPTGRVKEKRWLDVDDFETALTHAIEDFKVNYEKYLGKD